MYNSQYMQTLKYLDEDEIKEKFDVVDLFTEDLSFFLSQVEIMHRKYGLPPEGDDDKAYDAYEKKTKWIDLLHRFNKIMTKNTLKYLLED